MESNIESWLQGRRRGRITQEFFTNSAHFPAVNIFLELLLEGPRVYLMKPDGYALAVAACVQAYFLGSRMHVGRPRPLLGNLIGPALYTVVEAGIEGVGEFFASPQHLAYWGFALAIGFLQELRLHLSVKPIGVLILMDNFVRTNILLVGYWIFEALSEPRFTSIDGFLSDSSHIFVLIVIPLIGLIVGFANMTAQSYLNVLRETAARLKIYSEWLLGRNLLSRAMADPSSLILQRQERTVLFMDIRGFTNWSEFQPPEKVVAMLNSYFEAAERVWSSSSAIKVKLSADEIMIVFPTAQDAAGTALELRREIGALLSQHGLSAGIGLHSGPLVEGLLGSKDVKGYDVIGDTVNTANRLCDAAAGGEILISDGTYSAVGQGAVVLGARQIMVKGKNEPITVYPLEEFRNEAFLPSEPGWKPRSVPSA